MLQRARKEYWQNLKPSSGRPLSSSLSIPDSWGVTAGDSWLIQHIEKTTEKEMNEVFSKAKA